MTKGKELIKPIIVSTLLILFYFFQNYVELAIFAFIGIDYQSLNLTLQTLVLLLGEALIAGVIVFPYWSEIKSGLKDYWEHGREYFKKYFKYWILILVVMSISNLVISNLKSQVDATSVNEAELRNQFLQNPIYVYIAAVVFAPIMEELIFRRSIRTFFKSNTLFIIMSGICFGAVHLMTGIESVIDLLYMIPYGVPGIVFAYIYTKTDNITVPISMHIMHNGIQMSMQIILLLFM